MKALSSAHRVPCRLRFLPSEMEKAPPKPVNKELKAQRAQRAQRARCKLEAVTANKGILVRWHGDRSAGSEFD